MSEERLVEVSKGVFRFEPQSCELHPRTVVMAFHHPEYPDCQMFRPTMVQAMQEYDAWLNSDEFKQQEYRPGSKSDTDPFRASNGVTITFMVPGAA